MTSATEIPYKPGRRILLPVTAALLGEFFLAPFFGSEGDAPVFKIVGSAVFVAIVLGVTSAIVWLAMRSRKGWTFSRSLCSTRVAVVVVLICFFSAVGQASSDTSNAVGSTGDQEFSPDNPFEGNIPMSDVYFVPLDDHARTVIEAVAPSMKNWLPPATTITDVPTSRANWAGTGPHRGGFNAETISLDLLERARRHLGTRHVYIIGVTSKAIYSPDSPYDFTFGYVGYTANDRLAAVYGLQPMRAYQPEREQARLRKMMLRYIGQLWCGLPRNSNPRSVLFEPLTGTPDLDRMVPTLPARCRK